MCVFLPATNIPNEIYYKFSLSVSAFTAGIYFVKNAHFNSIKWNPDEHVAKFDLITKRYHFIISLNGTRICCMHECIFNELFLPFLFCWSCLLVLQVIAILRVFCCRCLFSFYYSIYSMGLVGVVVIKPDSCIKYNCYYYHMCTKKREKKRDCAVSTSITRCIVYAAHNRKSYIETLWCDFIIIYNIIH